jgi:hypothetical protein
MSQRVYNARHNVVSSQHASPPNSFLDQLIDAINPLPDEVFAQNNRRKLTARTPAPRASGGWLANTTPAPVLNDEQKLKMTGGRNG